AGFLQRGSGRCPDVYAQFARNELSERRFAESGRPKKKAMIQRLASRFGGVNPHAQTVFHLVLPYELRQALWSKRQLDDRLVGERLRCGDFRTRHRYTVSVSGWT